MRCNMSSHSTLVNQLNEAPETQPALSCNPLKNMDYEYDRILVVGLWPRCLTEPKEYRSM